MRRFFLYLFDSPALAWALVAAVSVPAAIGMSRLQFDDDYLNLIRSDESEFVALERSHDDFADEVHDLLIVVDSDDIVNADTLRALHALVESLAAHADFGAVLSIFDATRPIRMQATRSAVIPAPIPDELNAGELRNELIANPVIAGHLLDEEAKTTVVVTSVRTEPDGSLAIAGLERRLAEVRRLVDRSGLREHARVRLTGPPAIRSITVSSLARDQILFGITAFSLAIFVGWLLFRSPGVIVGVLAPPSVGVFWTLGYMGLVGESVNLINGTVAPLLLAITVTDTIHLVSENRILRLGGLDSRTAARSTLEHLAAPCMLTSLTTAIGFGSLITADIELVRRFGAVCSVGMLFCLLAVLTLVPIWSRTRWSRGLDDERVRAPVAPRPPAALAAMWRRPTVPVVTSVAVFFCLLFVAGGLRTDVRATTELPRDSEAYHAFRHLEDAFGGMLTAHLVVRWPEGQTIASRELRQVVAEVHEAIEQTDGAGRPFSILSVEAAMRGRDSGLAGPGAIFGFAPKSLLRRLIEPKTRSAVVYTRMRDEGARATIPVLEDLETRLDFVESRHPGFVVEQTGLLPVHVRTIDRLVITLARSLVFAVPVIFVTLAFAFGSLRLAIASVIPNALPLVAIAVYLVAVGRHVGIAGALSFTVALGIAVDDTIHFIDRYRKARETLPVAAAIESAWSSLARVMVVTSAVLIAGFGTLGWSEFAGIRFFGGLSCLALFVAAVGDLVVLPAWLARFDREA